MIKAMILLIPLITMIILMMRKVPYAIISVFGILMVACTYIGVFIFKSIMFTTRNLLLVMKNKILLYNIDEFGWITIPREKFKVEVLAIHADKPKPDDVAAPITIVLENPYNGKNSFYFPSLGYVKELKLKLITNKDLLELARIIKPRHLVTRTCNLVWGYGVIISNYPELRERAKRLLDLDLKFVINSLFPAYFESFCERNYKQAYKYTMRKYKPSFEEFLKAAWSDHYLVKYIWNDLRFKIVWFLNHLVMALCVFGRKNEIIHLLEFLCSKDIASFLRNADLSIVKEYGFGGLDNKIMIISSAIITILSIVLMFTFISIGIFFLTLLITYIMYLIMKTMLDYSGIIGVTKKKYFKGIKIGTISTILISIPVITLPLFAKILTPIDANLIFVNSTFILLYMIYAGFLLILTIFSKFLATRYIYFKKLLKIWRNWIGERGR